MIQKKISWDLASILGLPLSRCCSHLASCCSPNLALTAFGVMSLLESAFIAAGAMLVFRCCSPSQAMNAIKWNLLASLAGSIVLGLAIQKTGIAAWISQGILSINGSNPLIVMVAVCLVAALITEFLSNTSVAAIIVPIMYSAAIQLGYDPLPFLIALIMQPTVL